MLHDGPYVEAENNFKVGKILYNKIVHLSKIVQLSDLTHIPNGMTKTFKRRASRPAYLGIVSR